MCTWRDCPSDDFSTKLGHSAILFWASYYLLCPVAVLPNNGFSWISSLEWCFLPLWRNDVFNVIHSKVIIERLIWVITRSIDVYKRQDLHQLKLEKLQSPQWTTYLVLAEDTIQMTTPTSRIPKRDTPGRGYHDLL